VRHLDIEFVRPIRKGHRRWLGWLSALFARPAGQHRFAVRHIDCPETSGQAGLSNGVALLCLMKSNILSNGLVGFAVGIAGGIIGLRGGELRLPLSVPETRFVRIDGEARQESDARQFLRTARSGVGRARPSQAKREFALHCNRSHISQEFAEGARR